MAQYGEVRVDYITYTTGTVPTEANATVTVSSLVNDPTFSGDVQVGGDVTITGNLNVSGDSLFDGITVSGNSILNTLTVTGGSNLEDVEISGTLTVTGNTNLNNLTVTGNTNVNNLTVTGITVLDNLVVSGDINVEGNGTIEGNLGVSGNADISGDTIINGGLTVSGNSVFDNIVVSGNSTLNNLEVSGTSDLNILNVTGDSLLNNLTVTGNSSLNNLTVTGDASLNNLTVTGDINASGITISGFTGLFDDGTEASPSITFAGDQDTGFYRISANEIGFTASGDKKASFGSRTVFYGDSKEYRFAVNTEAHIGNFNTTDIPSVSNENIGGVLFRWNRSAGQAENNIYNLYTGPTGAGANKSFEFLQLTSGVGETTSGLLIAEMGRFQHYFAISGIYRYGMNNTGFGAGTINPQDDVDIYSVNPTLRLSDSDNPSYSRIVWDGTTSNRGLYIESDRGNNVANSRIIFSNDNTPQAFLATSGEFLLKDTYTIRNDLYNGSFGARFQIEGDTHNKSSIGLVRNQDTRSSAWLQFGKSRGATDSGVTTTVSGDQLGGISFAGSEGNGLLNGVIVTARVNDTVSSGNVPAELRVQHVVSGTAINSVNLDYNQITTYVPVKEINTSPSGVDTVNQFITEADIGTGPNQIPMNWMLGKDAYSSSKSVDTGYTFLRLGAVTPGSQYVRPLGDAYITCYYAVIQGRCFVEISSNASISATDKTDYLNLEGAAERDIIVIAGLPLLTLQQNIGTTYRGMIDYTYLDMVIKGWDTVNSAVMFSNGHNLGNTGPVVDSQGDTWWINTKFVPVVGPNYPRGLPPLINTAELNINFRDPITDNNQTAYNGWNSYFFIKPRASGAGNDILSELRIRDLWGEGQTGTTITMNARMYGSYQVE